LRWGAFAAAVALFGMALAVETVKPEWRDPEYGHRLKQLRGLVAANPGRPLVVALGSSRTQMGLHPVAMGFPDEPGSPLVYNFGQSAAGPLRQLLTFLRLRDAGIKPAFVLVELFPMALTADGPAERHLQEFAPTLAAADLRHLDPYCEDAAALRREWAANRAASWHALRLSLVSHWKPGWLPWPKRVNFQWEQLDPRGWTPFPIEDVSPERRAAGVAKARQEYADRLTGWRVGAASERALIDLVNRCRADGIGVAFYLTPEGPAFRSWYAPATRAAVDEYVERVRRDLAPVFDATGGFAEDEFYDSHHLLRGGAARFSKRLADEHLKAWARKARGWPL
jgi:hypothetical protein